MENFEMGQTYAVYTAFGPLLKELYFKRVEASSQSHTTPLPLCFKNIYTVRADFCEGIMY